MLKKTLQIMALCAILPASYADEVRLYKGGEIPKAREIADILSPPPGVKFRSIRLLPDDQTKQIPPPEAALAASPSPKPSKASAFALEINFGFDSYELTPQIKSQLDVVAEGMRIARVAKVDIEGHADAHGGASYNQTLSEKRALSVMQYLVGQHGFSPEVFSVSGKGESDPLVQENPFAPENRRVQFQAG